MRNRWLQLALIVWLAVTTVICLRVAWTPYRNTVYPILVHGARNWTAGVDLYHPDRQLTGFDAFVYPPPIACFYLTFADLSDRAGAILWRLASLAVYLAAFCYFVRSFVIDKARSPATDLGLLLLLLLPHSIDSLNNGQSNVLIAGLLVAGVTATLRERWNLAAVCLALAALFKIYPLAVGLLAVLRYPRLAPRLALALTLGLAAPLLFQTPDYVLEQYRSYWQWVLQENRTSWPLHNAPHDLYLLLRLLDVAPPRTIYLGLQLTAAAVVAGLAWRLERADKALCARRLLGLGVGWIIVFGPATESSTYTLLAPILAWEMHAAWTAGARTHRWTITAAYALLCLGGMSLWFRGGRVVARVLQPLAGLTHLLLQWRLAVRTPAPRPASAPGNAPAGADVSYSPLPGV